MATWGAYFYSVVSKKSDKPATEPVTIESSLLNKEPSDGQSGTEIPLATSKSEVRETQKLYHVDLSFDTKTNPFPGSFISNATRVAKMLGNTDPTASKVLEQSTIREPTVFIASTKDLIAPTTPTNPATRMASVVTTSPTTRTANANPTTPTTPMTPPEPAYEVNQMGLKSWTTSENTSISLTLNELASTSTPDKATRIASPFTSEISEIASILEASPNISESILPASLQESTNQLNSELSKVSVDTEILEMTTDLRNMKNPMTPESLTSSAGTITPATRLKLEGLQPPETSTDQMRTITIKQDIPANTALLEAEKTVNLLESESSFIDNLIEPSLAARYPTPASRESLDLLSEEYNKLIKISPDSTKFPIKNRNDYQDLLKNQSGDKKKTILPFLLPAELQSNATHNHKDFASNSLSGTVSQAQMTSDVPALNFSLLKPIILKPARPSIQKSQLSQMKSSSSPISRRKATDDDISPTNPKRNSLQSEILSLITDLELRRFGVQEDMMRQNHRQADRIKHLNLIAYTKSIEQIYLEREEMMAQKKQMIEKEKEFERNEIMIQEEEEQMRIFLADVERERKREKAEAREQLRLEQDRIEKEIQKEQWRIEELEKKKNQEMINLETEENATHTHSKNMNEGGKIEIEEPERKKKKPAKVTQEQKGYVSSGNSPEMEANRPQFKEEEHRKVIPNSQNYADNFSIYDYNYDVEFEQILSPNVFESTALGVEINKSLQYPFRGEQYDERPLLQRYDQTNRENTGGGMQIYADVQSNPFRQNPDTPRHLKLGLPRNGPRSINSSQVDPLSMDPAQMRPKPISSTRMGPLQTNKQRRAPPPSGFSQMGPPPMGQRRRGPPPIGSSQMGPRPMGPPAMGQRRRGPPPNFYSKMGPPPIGPSSMDQPRRGPPPMSQPRRGPPPMSQPRRGPPPMSQPRRGPSQISLPQRGP